MVGLVKILIKGGSFPRLSKKGVIPHPDASVRDLQPLIWTGDAGSGSGMTKKNNIFAI
jgi:hypothetical protein